MVDIDDAELAEEEAPQPRKRSAKKIVIFGAVAVLLFAMGGGGAWFLATSLASVDQDPDTAGADRNRSKASAGEQERKKRRKSRSNRGKGEAIYVPLEPPFTVNFEKQSGARFLQITVEALTRSDDTEEVIKKHMPVIRNNLVMLFSSKSSAELRTTEGKESLRKEALSAVQKVIEDETGEKGVEAVYFTSFVMQ